MGIWGSRESLREREMALIRKEIELAEKRYQDWEERFTHYRERLSDMQDHINNLNKHVQFLYTQVATGVPLDLSALGTDEESDLPPEEHEPEFDLDDMSLESLMSEALELPTEEEEEVEADV